MYGTKQNDAVEPESGQRVLVVPTCGFMGTKKYIIHTSGVAAAAESGGHSSGHCWAVNICGPGQVGEELREGAADHCQKGEWASGRLAKGAIQSQGPRLWQNPNPAVVRANKIFKEMCKKMCRKHTTSKKLCA